MTDFPKDTFVPNGLELLAYHPESIRSNEVIWRRAIWRTGRHYQELSYLSRGKAISTPSERINIADPILMLRERFTNTPLDQVVIKDKNWIYLTGPVHMQDPIECVKRRGILPCQQMDIPAWEALVADPIPTFIRFALL